MTTTPNLGLNKPVNGSSNWDVPLNANEDILDGLFPSSKLALSKGGTATDLSSGGGVVATTGKFVLKQDASHVITSAPLIAADIPVLAYNASGVFTNTQNNRNATIGIGSLDFDALEATFNGSARVTEGISVGIAVPPTGTVGVVNAIAGWATTESSDTVGVFGGVQALANGTKAFGSNFSVLDTTGLTSGVELIGSEIDVTPLNVLTAYASTVGCQATLGAGSHTGTYGDAFVAASNNTSTLWSSGFHSLDGAAANALIVGKAAASGVSGSQYVVFVGYDGANQHTAALSSDSVGDFVFTQQAGTFVQLSRLRLPGSSSGQIDIAVPAAAGAYNVWTLQAATDTFVGRATSDILTNKTLVTPTLTGESTVITGASSYLFRLTPSDDVEGTIFYGTNAANSDVLWQFGKSGWLSLGSGAGYPGVGGINITGAYYVNGTPGVTQTVGIPATIATIGGIVTTLTVTSDERLKDAVPYAGGLDEILAITPIRYRWNEKGQEIGGDGSREFVGFGAQNVQKAIPESIVGKQVAKDGAEYLGFDDRPIIAALVNAVKELQAEIELLKKAK